MLSKTDFNSSIGILENCACDFLGIRITSHSSGICAEFSSAWMKPLAISSNLVRTAEPAAAQRAEIILVQTLILLICSGFYPLEGHALSPGNPETIPCAYRMERWLSNTHTYKVTCIVIDMRGSIKQCSITVYQFFRTCCHGYPV